MSDVMPEPSPASPTAPPTAPTTLPGTLPPKPSGWPTVLGVVSLVFAGIGICGGGCGLVSPLYVKQMAAFSTTQPASMAFFEGLPWVWGMVSSGLTLVLQILLLVGAIGLLQRLRWARRICLVWSVAYILYALASVAVTFALQSEMEAAQNMPGSPMSPHVLRIMTAVSMVFGLIWNGTLPVFMLIWFKRPIICQEISTWK